MAYSSFNNNIISIAVWTRACDRRVESIQSTSCLAISLLPPVSATRSAPLHTDCSACYCWRETSRLTHLWPQLHVSVRLFGCPTNRISLLFLPPTLLLLTLFWVNCVRMVRWPATNDSFEMVSQRCDSTLPPSSSRYLFHPRPPSFRIYAIGGSDWVGALDHTAPERVRTSSFRCCSKELMQSHQQEQQR